MYFFPALIGTIQIKQYYYYSICCISMPLFDILLSVIWSVHCRVTVGRVSKSAVCWWTAQRSSPLALCGTLNNLTSLKMSSALWPKPQSLGGEGQISLHNSSCLHSFLFRISFYCSVYIQWLCHVLCCLLNQSIDLTTCRETGIYTSPKLNIYYYFYLS